jgi:cyclophilin family peptidyl-prolyl cis-trans isomerase
MTRARSVTRASTLLALALVAAACSQPSAALPTVPPETAAPSVAPSEATHPGPTYPPGCPQAQPPALGADDVRTVTIATPKGDIVIEVKGSLSPIATGNVVALASCGYYDGVIFHRLVPGLVIQGGDGQFGRSPNVFTDLVGSGGPPYTIQDEPVTTTYQRGTVAMARSSQPNSVGSQFFIVLDDAAATSLADPQYNNYQIVGAVTSGMDVVDSIAAMPNAGSPTNAALDPIPMTKVTVSTP